MVRRLGSLTYLSKEKWRTGSSITQSGSNASPLTWRRGTSSWLALMASLTTSSGTCPQAKTSLQRSSRASRSCAKHLYLSLSPSTLRWSPTWDWSCTNQPSCTCTACRLLRLAVKAPVACPASLTTSPSGSPASRSAGSRRAPCRRRLSSQHLSGAASHSLTPSRSTSIRSQTTANARSLRSARIPDAGLCLPGLRELSMAS
mmetsp:Transcript_34047/g.96476  ORF Transcript_34047/g.96476 Transcript_34047/m.96476 type:complete len:202 (+) Transcript_34047:344-949(+)